MLSISPECSLLGRVQLGSDGYERAVAHSGCQFPNAKSGSMGRQRCSLAACLAGMAHVMPCLCTCVGMVVGMSHTRKPLTRRLTGCTILCANWQCVKPQLACTVIEGNFVQHSVCELVCVRVGGCCIVSISPLSYGVLIVCFDGRWTQVKPWYVRADVTGSTQQIQTFDAKTLHLAKLSLCNYLHFNKDFFIMPHSHCSTMCCATLQQSACNCKCCCPMVYIGQLEKPSHGQAV